MMPNSKALVRATVGTIWLVVVMTLAAEFSEPFKALLAETFTHHWIGKSVLAAAIYVGTSIIIFAVPSAGSQEQARKSLAAGTTLPAPTCGKTRKSLTRF